jgi:hypothetical protein
MVPTLLVGIILKNKYTYIIASDHQQENRDINDPRGEVMVFLSEDPR